MKKIKYNKYKITGKVFDRIGNNYITDPLKIEAWDKEEVCKECICSETTHADGAFKMNLSDADLKKHFLGRKPNLFFKVFYGDKLIQSTEDSVSWDIDTGNKNVKIEVADFNKIKEKVTKKTFTVSGRVIKSDGRGVNYILVRVWDWDLRGEQVLGAMSTDDEGKYSISYPDHLLCRPDDARPNLIVRAYDQGGEKVAQSPVIMDASDNQVIDLVDDEEPYRGPTEYTRLNTKLKPLLYERDPATLEEVEVDYLATKTGIDPQHIAYFVNAAKFEKESKINREALYGLFRQNMPTNLPALITHDPKALRSGLEAAISNNVVSADLKSKKEMDDVVKKAQDQVIAYAFKKDAGTSDSASLGALLNTAVIDISEQQQKVFLQKYIKHDKPIEEFWNNMRKDKNFGTEKVDAIQLTLQLGALALKHLPLVKVLQKEFKALQKQEKNKGTFTVLRELLAQKSLDDWKSTIKKKIDGKAVGVPPSIQGSTETEKINNYAQIITRMVEDAFPTAVIAHRIKNNDFPHAKCYL